MIVFVQVPGFYAAVEQVDHPVDAPIIVGGDPGKGGTVTSASAAARDAGVVAGMDVREAQKLCPSAELRPTRLRRYREVAAEVRAVLRSASERIEPEGLDSSYLEPPAGADPVTVAAQLCVRIQAELGLRAVAGLGPTRFVAHLAGVHAGSAGLREVRSDEARAFLSVLPITEIWGLGPATAEKLAHTGVEVIADLQEMSLAGLEAVVGARNASAFITLARGEEDRPLRPAPPIKSLSREVTLDSPSGDLRSLGDEITGLAHRLEEMLNRERRASRTVTLGVNFVDGERVTRTLTLDRPIARPNEIADVGLQLLGRTQAGVRQVRRMRLQLSNLSRPEGAEPPQQLKLF